MKTNICSRSVNTNFTCLEGIKRTRTNLIDNKMLCFLWFFNVRIYIHIVGVRGATLSNVMNEV